MVHTIGARRAGTRVRSGARNQSQLSKYMRLGVYNHELMLGLHVPASMKEAARQGISLGSLHTINSIRADGVCCKMISARSAT